MTKPGDSIKREQRCLCVVLLLISATGCSLSGFRDRLDTVVGVDDPKAISHVSVHHNDRGLHYLSKGKFGKAETHFQKAINSDPRSAAAHNNIGNLMLSRHELYQAAWEFQRAYELSSGSIEPLVNLGLVHEEGDRLDEAADYYRQAIAIEPNNAVAVGNLTRVLVKQDADPLEIHGLLKHLIFVDTRPDWIEWAEEIVDTRYRVDGSPRGQLQNSSDGTYARQPPQPQGLVMPESIQWATEPPVPLEFDTAPGSWSNGNEPIDSLPAPLRPNSQMPSLNSLKSPEGAYLPNVETGSGSQFPQGTNSIPSSAFQVVSPAVPYFGGRGFGRGPHKFEKALCV